MIVHFHKHFEKMRAKLSVREQERCDERIALFISEPFNPLLYNHQLNGKYHGYRSIRIGGDLFAVYKNINEENVVFVRVGTHHEIHGT